MAPKDRTIFTVNLSFHNITSFDQQFMGFTRHKTICMIIDDKKDVM